ncbi:MAG: inner membrane protein [Bacteroidia bacterium]|jgi:inner membrane protein
MKENKIMDILNNKPTFSEKYSAIIKMVMIGVLILLLLIPAYMVQDVIHEREENQTNVKQEISSKWGQGQTLTGPIVSIPYEIDVVEDRPRTITKYIHLLPSELTIEGDVDTTLLSRSIYDVIAYTARLKVSGKFDGSELLKMGGIPSSADWENATLNIGITDLTGVQDRIQVKWGNDTFNFNPGVDNRDNYRSGVSAPISFSADKKMDFSFDLNLKGSEYINFVPVGKETKVSLTSKCPNPNFHGSFLPTKRSVDDDGFSGEWKVLHLNRNYPQAWDDTNQQIENSAFGVEMMLDVDPYQKTMRSAKYAILFIAMTFLTFFFIEILGKKRIHPIQYILIGLVLILFYVLLLSMSEQFGFNVAYFIGALAVILLVTIYTASVLRSNQQSMIMFTILTVLYGFIYIIIQMAEYSLLFGSIGLFLFLAAVMIASRKVDWYNIGLKEGE